MRLLALIALALAVPPVASASPVADRDGAATTFGASIDTTAPAAPTVTDGSWGGFTAGIADTTSQRVNVVIAGGYVAVHFKLSGPIISGDPLAGVATPWWLESLDCATVAGWTPNPVAWSGDFPDTGTRYMPKSKDYAFGFIAYWEEIDDCGLLTVTLRDGSKHTAAFLIVPPPPPGS